MQNLEYLKECTQHLIEEINDFELFFARHAPDISKLVSRQMLHVANIV